MAGVNASPVLRHIKVLRKLFFSLPIRTASLWFSPMVTVSDLTWILVVLSVLGNIFVIYDRRITGYIVWLIANSGWIAYNIYIGEYSQMVLFLVYSVLSVLGIHTELSKVVKVPTGVEDGTVATDM